MDADNGCWKETTMQFYQEITDDTFEPEYVDEQTAEDTKEEVVEVEATEVESTEESA